MANVPVKDPFVESLNAIIDARIEQKFAALNGQPTAVYKTQPPSARAPGCKTSRSMVTKIKRYGMVHTIEGDATRAVYIVRAVDWHAALRRPSKPSKPVLRLVPSADEDIAEAAMQAAGLRSTRGGR